MLIGWVRCGARAAARPAIPGALYLEDQEAAVPVLVRGLMKLLGAGLLSG